MFNLLNIKIINIACFAFANLLNFTSNLTDERSHNDKLNTANDESSLCSYALVVNRTTQFLKSQFPFCQCAINSFPFNTCQSV